MKKKLKFTIEYVVELDDLFEYGAPHGEILERLRENGAANVTDVEVIKEG